MEEPIIQTEDQPNNLLEQLAAKRSSIADTKDVLIPIPGYDTAPPVLMAKYRLLTGKDLERIADSVSRKHKGRWERQLHAAIETFVSAVMGIYYDLQDGSAPAPLTYKGVPILGFTPDLAEALGFADRLDDPNRPSEVLFGLFGNNEVMISQHSIQLQRWMSNTSTDVSADLLGNL